MAFNFGEVLARQVDNTVQLQAQNRQNMMQMINQLKMQEQSNLQKIEEFRQRKLELNLQDRIQAFREAQAVREAEYNERKLGLEERLTKLRESLIPDERAKTQAEARAAGARAGYYGAQADRAKTGAKMTGQAGVLNATVRAGENEIERNLTQAEDLTGEIKKLEAKKENDSKGLFERGSDYQRRIGERNEMLNRKTATRDSLVNVSNVRQREILNAIQQFQQQYGVTPLQAEQAATGTPTQRMAFDPED